MNVLLRLYKKYVNDPSVRVKTSLFGSVSLNIGYIIMQLTSGFLFRAWWFYALAVYYSLLIVMRLFLLGGIRKRKESKNLLKELCLYRFCGICLLVMNQALAVIVYFTVRQNRSFDYGYFQTVIMGLYTLCVMIVAVANVVRYRRYESPVLSAAKAINLASAAVSLLSLEGALVEVFASEQGEKFRKIGSVLTGAVVCFFVLCMAIYMIVTADKKIKKLKRKQL